MRALLPALRWMVIALLLALTLLPIHWMITTSLRPDGEVTSGSLSLLPHTWTLEHYRAVFTEHEVGRYLLNSVIIAACSTLLSVGLALPGAYAFARLRYPGRVLGVLRVMVLSARFVPPFAVALPLFILFRKLDLLDTRTALILASTVFSIPFALWILQAGFEELPLEIEEAALVDGCDRWQIFLRIALPLVGPSIVCAAIFSLLLSWNEFLFALLIVVDDAATLPLLASKFLSDRYMPFGDIAAVATIASVPVMLFVIFAQRYLVRGLTAGSLK
jgi:ABC-type glycerol-3-phosphate transport system permease component